MPKYFVYHLYPIDMGWHRLHVLDNELPEPIATAARGIGWEGDVRGHNIGWFPMPAPGENSFAPAYVWKQDNNGSTFVASPAEINFGKDNVVESTTAILSSSANVEVPG